ncbi:LCP family protein [Actinomycetospora endophytica]|uniref:LCP family protein n=1 Tax=Actinomycetospora endophytica TaxID=2291215 RepID=A0ABS8PHX6_9PSEU|nr:LCP family protein [Actinomycetospora endophytica]MCD2197865.1 LCP family protein [Actinomycetospora endophytica]
MVLKPPDPRLVPTRVAPPLSGTRPTGAAPAPPRPAPGPPGRSPAPPPPAASGGRRRGRGWRVAVAVLSAAVLVGCGTAWVSIHGVGGADVISDGVADNGAQNILLVGLDTRTDAHGNPLPADQLAALHAGSSDDGGDNTDTMIVIHIPAGGGAATAFSIPRDSYVQLAGDFGAHKINTAYTYGENAARPQLAAQGQAGPALAVATADAGAREAIGTVQQLTGLTITHYAAINLAAFDAISNAAGGVQVCLLAPTRDDFSGANFPAGVQTISGAAALAFVRQRHGLPNGDLDRIRRQQVFMAALSAKLLSAGTLTSPSAMGGLVQAVDDDVVLDQNWDLLSFAEQLHGLSAGAVTFRTVPTGSTDLQTPEDGTAVQIDPTQVQGFIQNAIDPAPPSTSTAPPAPPQAPVHADGSVDSVEVLNGSGQGGAASSALNTLTEAGFSPSDTGDAHTRPDTTIQYAPSDQADAVVAQAVLGAGVTLTPDESLSPGRLRITLGTDLPASGAASPSSASAPPPAPISAGAIPCIN